MKYEKEENAEPEAAAAVSALKGSGCQERRLPLQVRGARPCQFSRAKRFSASQDVGPRRLAGGARRVLAVGRGEWWGEEHPTISLHPGQTDGERKRG